MKAGCSEKKAGCSGTKAGSLVKISDLGSKVSFTTLALLINKHFHMHKCKIRLWRQAAMLEDFIEVCRCEDFWGMISEGEEILEYTGYETSAICDLSIKALLKEE